MSWLLCLLGVHGWYRCPHMESKKLDFWHCSYCESAKTSRKESE